MFKIKSNFIGKFKIGDNINYNLEVLALLYKYYDKASDNQKKLLCKPIIILLISIIEAVLYDLHYRINNHTKEGIINIKDCVLNLIRSKKIDQFERYIASVKKQDFFDSRDDRFYEALDLLRKIRNRIHIQNEKQQLDDDEKNVFTEKRKKLAEKVLEKTLKQMIKKYPRDEKFHCVNKFKLPWNEYFLDDNKQLGTNNK